MGLKILGIDPGSIICGYGVIEQNNNKHTLVEYGVIRAKKLHDDLPSRIKEIFERLQKVIERTNPDIAVFESTFYAKNAQSLMKLSHARAVAILAAKLAEIEINEYSPKEVKKSVTGRGNASKEQVQFMVKKILNIEETPEFFDSTDALAAALCHCFRQNSSSGKAQSWETYIKENPNKIVKR